MFSLCKRTVRVNEKLTFPHRPVSVVRKRYGSGTAYVRNRYAYACTVYGVHTEPVRLRVHSLWRTYGIDTLTRAQFIKYGNCPTEITVLFPYVLMRKLQI